MLRLKRLARPANPNSYLKRAVAEEVTSIGREKALSEYLCRKRSTTPRQKKQLGCA
ncbi:MAG: hypothetical protein AAF718_06125 [Pseudomonadota bacterium]